MRFKSNLYKFVQDTIDTTVGALEHVMLSAAQTSSAHVIGTQVGTSTKFEGIQARCRNGSSGAVLQTVPPAW